MLLTLTLRILTVVFILFFFSVEAKFEVVYEKFLNNIKLSLTIADEDLQIYALVRLNRILQIYRLPLAFSFKESDVETRTGGTKWVLSKYIHLKWLG